MSGIKIGLRLKHILWKPCERWGTDNIVGIQGTRISWFNTRLGPKNRKKIHLMYVLYILYVIYIVYILYAYYIYIYIYIYILPIYVESKVSGI